MVIVPLLLLRIDITDINFYLIIYDLKIRSIKLSLQILPSNPAFISDDILVTL
jgi:hypothetical protein